MTKLSAREARRYCQALLLPLFALLAGCRAERMAFQRLPAVGRINSPAQPGRALAVREAAPPLRSPGNLTQQDSSAAVPMGLEQASTLPPGHLPRIGSKLRRQATAQAAFGSNARRHLPLGVLPRKARPQHLGISRSPTEHEISDTQLVLLIAGFILAVLLVLGGIAWLMTLLFHISFWTALRYWALVLSLFAGIIAIANNI
jgi:hypothetical protein